MNDGEMCYIPPGSGRCGMDEREKNECILVISSEHKWSSHDVSYGGGSWPWNATVSVLLSFASASFTGGQLLVMGMLQRDLALMRCFAPYDKRVRNWLVGTYLHLSGWVPQYPAWEDSDRPEWTVISSTEMNNESLMYVDQAHFLLQSIVVCQPKWLSFIILVLVLVLIVRFIIKPEIHFEVMLLSIHNDRLKAMGICNFERRGLLSHFWIKISDMRHDIYL